MIQGDTFKGQFILALARRTPAFRRNSHAVRQQDSFFRKLATALARTSPSWSSPSAEETFAAGPAQGKHLTKTDLRFAKLSRADLNYADLTYADLTGAVLTTAWLLFADLSHASLRNARLGRANPVLDAPYPRGAELIEAKLIGTDLSYADMSYAVLQGADCTDANFMGADLTNADLRRAKLTGANFAKAKLGGLLWNTETRWPDELGQLILDRSVEYAPGQWRVREGTEYGRTTTVLVW